MEHVGRVQSPKVQRVSRTFSENAQEHVLCPAIPFAKGMNRIEFRDEVSCLSRKCFAIQSAEFVISFQPGEQTAHLRIDVFGVAEHADVLAHPYRTDLAGPVVNVLEQMTMNGEIVIVLEITDR